MSEHSVESALQEVADLAKSAVHGASEVSLSLVARERADTVVATGQLAVDLDESQYERGYGHCLDAALRREVMHIDDAVTEARWCDYSQVAAARGAFSSVSIPIIVQEAPAVSAALNVYSTQPHAFDKMSLRTATTFASYAESTLGNLNAHHRCRELVQRLAQAMGTRPILDQAKGILMSERGCTEGEAFGLLVAASQRKNLSLRAAAKEVVNSVLTRPKPTRHQP